MPNRRANALADRLEKGASALASLARTLSDSEWQARLPKDGRKVGVIVHHVASVYPIEISLAQTLAGGKPVEGVTWPGIHEMNAGHAKEFDGVTKEAAIDLQRRRRRPMRMRRSPVSSCSKITQSATVITISR